MVVDNEIEEFVIRNVRDHPRDIVRLATERFGYSRQGVYRHVKKLVDAGILAATGQTRAREYSLAKLAEKRFAVSLEGLQEDAVWRNEISPVLQDPPENVRRIAQYGFTEILNNAIVHSQGTSVTIGSVVTAANLEFVIWDDGIGIFKKIKDELFLEDERHSILELSKGKLTTNPARHSGEGIFFTTRSFDDLTILAGSLSFIHNRDGDWLIDDRSSARGTFVSMHLDLFTKRSLREVFDDYAARDDDYGFTRTRIPIFLAKYGDESLVSRSQAKRVVARLDRFKEVVLDFEGINTIGQAFADEIFRVFQNDHPDVHLVCMNANEEVSEMVRRTIGRVPAEDQLDLI